MDLKEIFSSGPGFGVLSTADIHGRVNSAVYARPHVLAEDRVAFIMSDRRSHANLDVNPRAAYLFRKTDSDKTHEGVRLQLTRMEETEDPERIEPLLRRSTYDRDKRRFLVTFRVDERQPLIGAGDEEEREA